jgi:GNAT superfamily N-acetyltransferase
LTCNLIRTLKALQPLKTISDPVAPWEIVEYNPEHTEKLRHIYLDSRRSAFPWLDLASLKPEDFDEVIQEEEVLVALHGRSPIGFIAWWPPDNFIHSLFIDPEFTGKGVGRLLLETCLQRTGRPATLKCFKANQNALGFYESQNWRIVSEGESAEGDYFLLSIT